MLPLWPESMHRQRFRYWLCIDTASPASIRIIWSHVLKIFDKIHCSMRYLLLRIAITLLARDHERSWDGAPLKNAYTATQMLRPQKQHGIYQYSDKNEKKGLVPMYLHRKEIFRLSNRKKFHFDDIPNQVWIVWWTMHEQWNTLWSSVTISLQPVTNFTKLSAWEMAWFTIKWDKQAQNT